MTDVQKLINQAVKKGLSKHKVPKKTDETAPTAKKAASVSLTKSAKKVTKVDAKQEKKKTVLKKKTRLSSKKKVKLPRRELYQPEEKVKRKKPKRMALTPLIIDEHPPVLKSLKTQKKSSKAKAEPVIEENAESNVMTAYMPTEEEVESMIRDRAIRGMSDCPSLLHDPLEDAGLPKLDSVQEYLEQKAQENKTENELLERAHNYFSQLNRDERRRNTAAMKRLKEMKKVNRAGGDKDGFKYIIPKNVSTVVRQIMAAEGVEGSQVDPEQLESHFGGDGIADTETKPMRSRKQRNRAFDDFYQFQVAKKWTRNAESFLARGRANKNMFAAKQKQLRTIKKL